MSESDLEEEILVKKRARVILITWVAGGLLVLWMLVSSALDMWAGYEAHMGREHLADCVTPGGECFQDSQDRTGDAVQRLIEDNQQSETITRATILASIWCDRQPGIDNLVKLENCVKSQLELQEKDRGDG